MSRLQGILIAFLCLLFFMIAPRQLWAVQLHPSFFDLAVAKGEKITKTLTVGNEGKEPLQFLLEASDVRFTKIGTPQFLGSEHIPADSLLWWVNFDKGPYTLLPGQAKTIELTVAIPSDVDPGGHYGALLVTPLTKEEKGKPASIGLESKIAALLFADVAGTAYRHFSITQFGSTQSLYADPAVSFNLQLTNDGVTHLQPHGTITIENNFTHEKVGELVVNEDFHYLMPKTSQSFHLTWQARGSSWSQYFGKYTTTVSLSAAHAPSQTAQVTFWIIPVVFLLSAAGVAVLLLIVLAVYTWYIIRRHATR